MSRPVSACGRHRLELRSIGWTRWGVLVAVPIVFLAVPSLAHFPARLVAGCPKWIALAALLELASILGFIACFSLVFGAGLTRRQSVVAALRALGASAVLPAGGLVGPALGARSTNRRPAPFATLVRSTIAFTILTTAPSVAALALFGVGLWLGWPAGPHQALLTLPAGAVAVALLVLFWLLGRSAALGNQSQRSVSRLPRWLSGGAGTLRGGAAQAGNLLAAGDWRLLGAVVYYAFDNAVLWAAFHAYGSTPPLGVIVMGYLVGSLAAAAPIPGGVGAVEGGLIGALVLYGAPAAPAAGAVLLYRGISLGLAVALGATAWAIRRAPGAGPPRTRDDRRSTLGASRHSIMLGNTSPEQSVARLPLDTKPDDAAATTPISLQVHAGPRHSWRLRR